MPALFWAGLVLVPTYAAIDVARFPAPTDFRCVYTAARLVAHGEDPYDRAAWTRAVGGPAPDGAGIVRPSPCRGFDRAGAPLDRFAYPLWTALLLAPFGLLSLSTAAALWVALLLAGTFAGIVLVWRTMGPPGTSALLFATVVLTSEPFWLTLENAQLGGVLLVLAALSMSWGARRHVAAGFTLALLALKPHLVLLTLATAMGWAIRRAPAIAISAATTGAGIVLATIALRSEWIGEWLAQLPGEQGTSGTFNHGTLGQLAALWGMPGWTAVALGITLSTALVWATRRASGSLADIVAASLVAGLLLAPYAGSYDHLLLAPAWARIIGIAFASTGAKKVGLLAAVVGSASLLPWTLYAIDEALTALGVIATALVLVAALGPASEARAALPTYQGAP